MRPMKRTLTWTAALLIALSAAPHDGQAQAFIRSGPPPAEEVRRAEAACRKAAADDARKAISEIDALQTTIACPENGPPLLAAYWDRVRDSTDVLELLVERSLWMRDARIADAVIRVLRDRTKPAVVRVAAIRVMATLLDPKVVVGFGRIYRPPNMLTDPPTLGDEFVMTTLGVGISPRLFRQGSVPVTEETQQKVVQALRDMKDGPDDHYLLLVIGQTLVSPPVK